MTVSSQTDHVNLLVDRVKELHIGKWWKRLSVLENCTDWHGLLLTQDRVKFLNFEKRLNRVMNDVLLHKRKTMGGGVT